MVKLSCAVLCVAVLLAASVNATAVQYRIQDLGTLSGGVASNAYDVNDFGRVVGWSSSSSANYARPVTWSPQGAISMLGTVTGKPYGASYAVSSTGQAVGVLCDWSDTASGVATLWNANGNPTILGTLPGDHYSAATAINSNGQVVGWSKRAGARYSRAFLWSASTGMQEITLLPNAVGGVATDINDTGHIVGYAVVTKQLPGYLEEYSRAFRRDGSTITDLGTVAGKYSTAQAISSNGQVVGESTFATDHSQTHAAFWSPQGTATDLTPSIYWAFYTWATDVNNLGQIVGTSYLGDQDHAALWDGAGHVTDLGTLSPQDNYSHAMGINNSGLIVGYGHTSSGDRAFLWTPVPEPSTLLVLLCGIGGMSGVMWRRWMR